MNSLRSNESVLSILHPHSCRRFDIGGQDGSSVSVVRAYKHLVETRLAKILGCVTNMLKALTGRSLHSLERSASASSVMLVTIGLGGRLFDDEDRTLMWRLSSRQMRCSTVGKVGSGFHGFESSVTCYHRDEKAASYSGDMYITTA